MKNDSEWEVFEEQRERRNADGSLNYTYKVTGIRRKDKLTLIQDATTMHHSDTYLLKGSFGEFRFIANRWDESKEKPADYFVVTLFIAPSEKDRELCILHSKEVEEALLHFPPPRIYNFTPVKKVVFNIGDRHGPRFVSAKEIRHD